MLTGQDLQRMLPVLNLRGLCEAAGLSYEMIRQRLKRGGDLRASEAARLEETLRQVGLCVCRAPGRSDGQL